MSRVRVDQDGLPGCGLTCYHVDTPVHEGCAWQPRKELKHILEPFVGD